MSINITKFKIFCHLLIIIFFSNNVASAQKLTNYEMKDLCFEQSGNWRRFSDSCADSCEAKFNIYSSCMQSLTYACDCGDKKCYYQNKCIDKYEYKKIFDKEKDLEQKELEEMRVKRIEKLNTDPAYSNYLSNLYPTPQINQNENTKNSKSKNRNQRQLPTQPLLPGAEQDFQISQPGQIIRQIPPGYMQQQNKSAVNSQGKSQDLAFPVVPLPSN